MNIKCINCGYFLNCNKANERLTECDNAIKIKRIINKGDYEILEKKKETRKN